MNQPPRLFPLFFALACGALASNSAQAASEVVFNNTVSLTTIGVFGPSAYQVGNEITLAGQSRQITLVSWAVYTQNSSLWAPVETHIYANDGAGGAPGTLLWSSGIVTNYLSATDTLLNVPVPNLTVPDTITVTSRVLDGAPVALGRDYASSPTVGTLNASWVEESPGVWNQFFGPWAMEVVAVPEPSAISLILAVLVAALFRFRVLKN